MFASHLPGLLIRIETLCLQRRHLLLKIRLVVFKLHVRLIFLPMNARKNHLDCCSCFLFRLTQFGARYTSDLSCCKFTISSFFRNIKLEKLLWGQHWHRIHTCVSKVLLLLRLLVFFWFLDINKSHWVDTIGFTQTTYGALTCNWWICFVGLFFGCLICVRLV